jgi:hypothetical protein
VYRHGDYIAFPFYVADLVRQRSNRIFCLRFYHVKPRPILSGRPFGVDMDGVPTDLIRRESNRIGLGYQIAGAARVNNSGIFADAGPTITLGSLILFRLSRRSSVLMGSLPTGSRKEVLGSILPRLARWPGGSCDLVYD